MAVWKSTCGATGCEDIVGLKGAKGFCVKHYHRFKRTGDPLVAVLDKVCPDCSRVYTPRNALSHRCDDCRVEFRKRAYAEWCAANPGYHTEWNRKWRAENPEAAFAYGVQYRQANADLVRERYNDWAARNPDYATKWLEANRDRARETVRRRRARLRSVPTFAVTDRDLRRMLARHNGCCAYCGNTVGDDYHVDHVVPVSLGGSHSIGNLAPACPTCNVSKSNWLLSEWRYRDRLSRPLRRRKSTHERAEAA